MSDEAPLLSFTPAARQRMLERRILILDGELNDDNGTLLMTQLALLAADDSTSDVTLWIHSPGGSVAAMLAIRDLMHTVPCDVGTLVLGIACSAGQFLLSAGARGKRRALPHSRVLMHQGSAGIGGTAVDVEMQANDLRLTRDTVLGLIAADTGQSVERVFEDSLHDRWYTADLARQYGFVDEIVTDFAAVSPILPRRPIGLTAHAAKVSAEGTVQ